MMDIVIKSLVVCLVAALLATVLKKSNPEMALLLALGVVAVVLLMVLDRAAEIMTFLQEAVNSVGVPAAWFSPLLKAVPIALISRLGAELCRDASQSAMAALVEMVGAFGVMLVILPLFEVAWELLRSLQ